ncbi:MAG TPA: glutamine-synthetase adenylyltransferase [Bryobacteraceae bacterium]|jgi:glutamate-ammonia-ligase adenylyltransferase|nr:glutamine-synthetase adenylyltransferase [Bryobacteraceae bacterium]
MSSLLETIAFRQLRRSQTEMAALERGLPPPIQNTLELLLASSADPDAAVHYLSSFKQQKPDAFEKLAATQPGLQNLIATFSHSHFLSDEILQNPEWLEQLTDLDRALSAEEYKNLLASFLDRQPAGTSMALSLALFRRQQILRILLRDVRGFCSLPETTEELSNLADAILDVSYQRIRADLVARHGVPHYVDGSGQTRECGMSVIALGKLGGRELNYSSDIDLMFVYTANGETDGDHRISNKEFYKKVANQYTELLSTYTAEGMCYRVDLRLRPDGSLGEVCISLDGAKSYYQSRARDWELQMLIKARVAAGDIETGRDLLESVEPLIYSTSLDFSAIEAVSVTRERISEKLNRRRLGKSALDVKLAPGGIRDIEFLVQCLQRLHGGRVPWVRHGGTMLALGRLADKDLLSAAEHGRLVSAYRFLRNLEHRLQFADDRQTHTLPTAARELDLLSRKMPSAQLGSAPSGEKLLHELNANLEAVQEIYQRVIHAQRPTYYTLPPPSPAEVGPEPEQPETGNLARFLDQRAPELASTMTRVGLRRGTGAFEHFLEKIAPHPKWLSLLDSDAAVAAHTLNIFEHSPYFAEELIRMPELLDELSRFAESGASALGEAGHYDDISELRRFFRREMFRTQTASLCMRVPVFETLQHTSDLADAAIAASYRMALQQVAASHPPSTPGYQLRNQLLVVALGRLGMREFDLASDADLVFVLPDEDRDEQVFWTRVAGRMIDLITAYTGAGLMFSVDTRLRPNGSAGALVQSEASYMEYFSKNAEAWEGIAYMKSRAITGDTERATKFLNELQQVDWRRYGQSGRSKRDLRQMRMRLEKEQGAGHPLKAGLGGFYDIDFLLMYLRLKGAGIFFKVLNTPERINIIEAMGHLERADAEFLRDAATFYRAVDHGLRAYSGHTEGSLPNSESQLEVLTDLVHRWTPEHLNQQPLKIELSKIQNRTREIFDRLFSG